PGGARQHSDVFGPGSAPRTVAAAAARAGLEAPADAGGRGVVRGQLDPVDALIERQLDEPVELQRAAEGVADAGTYPGEAAAAALRFRRLAAVAFPNQHVELQQPAPAAGGRVGDAEVQAVLRARPVTIRLVERHLHLRVTEKARGRGAEEAERVGVVADDEIGRAGAGLQGALGLGAVRVPDIGC